MRTFAETFSDYGIYGMDRHSTGEHRAKCPECPKRQPYKHQSSERDRDLAVNVDKGTWLCHRCGWSGGLKKERREFVKPVFTPIQSKSKPLEDINLKYFLTRGITKEVIERNKITKDKIYMSETGKETPVICFNYFVGDDLVNIKYRDLDKHFQQVKGGAKVFYKLNDIENETECIITEGEFDALSFEVAGFKNAISVPDGGINANVSQLQNKLSYLDNCADYFQNIRKIYLATDNDIPGIRLREELARRLGKGKCWLVKFPDGLKDANDVLVKYGKNALIESVMNAEPYPVEGVHYAKDRKDELLEIYNNGYPNGAKTGWYNFDDKIRFFESTLCVITGIPSHGKSNFMDHLMVRLSIENGWKFAVFSPENAKIEMHLHRLTEIITGKPFLPGYNGRMTLEEVEKATNWIDNNIFFILPKDEDYTLTNILEAASYLVLKHGIKGLVIDPWNTISHDYKNDSETEYTKKILNQLTYFERNHGLCLFIVAHPAKMRKVKDTNKYELPNLYDISGSAHWFNKAEVGITVYREFNKEMNDTLFTAVYVQKVKHRFMGQVGFTKFDFDKRCQRYYEKDEQKNERSYLESYTQLSKDGYPESWD